jgi:hypothetical protein
MSRQDRQRAQIVSLARHGEPDRARALAHEHLAEFPDDEEIASVLGEPTGGEVLEDLA